MVIRMKLFYSLTITLLFLACSPKEKVEAHIPTSYSGITKINLPRMKDKLLSWELIKNYILSSNSDKEDLNFSLDLNRPAYIGHNKNFDTISVFFPIDNEAEFETLVNTLKEEDIKKTNGYKSVKIKPLLNTFHYMHWSKDVAILSSTKNHFSYSKDCTNINTNLTQLSSDNYDISSILISPINEGKESTIRHYTDFENGHISMIIDGDQVTKDYFIDSIAKKITAKKTLCFTTDSCILGLSTKIEPKALDKNIKFVLPYLQQYGLMFSEQYENMKPHFDGRIYLGVSKLKISKGLLPEAKIVFGMKEGYRQDLDTSDLKEMTQCPDSDYLVDNEQFQYVLPEKDYIIYSNHNESNTELLNRPTLLNFQVNKEVINEQLFTIPRSYFGNELIDNFPFANIEFDVHEKEKHLESCLIIRFKDQEKNSLETMLNYMKLIKNKEEI